MAREKWQKLRLFAILCVGKWPAEDVEPLHEPCHGEGEGQIDWEADEENGVRGIRIEVKRQDVEREDVGAKDVERVLADPFEPDVETMAKADEANGLGDAAKQAYDVETHAIEDHGDGLVEDDVGDTDGGDGDPQPPIEVIGFGEEVVATDEKPDEHEQSGGGGGEQAPGEEDGLGGHEASAVESDGEKGGGQEAEPRKGRGEEQLGPEKRQKKPYRADVWQVAKENLVCAKSAAP